MWRELISQKFGHEDFRATTGHVSSHLSRIAGSPLLACLEILQGGIATLSQRGINPLHDDVRNFAVSVCQFAEKPLRAKVVVAV